MKTILFDVDGTLLNTDMLIIRSYMHVFDKFRPDYPLSIQELISFLGPVLKEVFPRYFGEDFDTLFAEYHQYSKKNIKRFVTPFQDVEWMIKTLKDSSFQLGIVTNRFKDSFHEVTEPFPFFRLFDLSVCLDDIKNPKPDPEGILKAMKELNAKKEDTIYVGDNESDFLAAKNAGIKVALVSWSFGRDFSYLHPDYFLSSFKQFVKEMQNDR